MPKEKSNTQKLVRGMSSQTLVTLINGVVEILSFSIMSRLLSKSDFGYYASITAITTIFSTLSEAGIGSAIIQKKDADNNYINNAFTLSFIFGSVVSVSLFLLSGVLSEWVADSTMRVPLMLMSITLLLHCMTSVNCSMMHKKLQFLRVGVINLVATILTTILAVVLAYKGFGYYAIITKAIVSSILTWIISYILVHYRFRFSFKLNVYKEIFGFSGWLMAGSLLRNLSQQIDKLMMGKLLSIEELGAYNRPKDFIANITARFNSIFDTALFPVLSNVQDNMTSMRNAYKKSTFFLNLFGMLLCMMLFLNSSLIIRIFFGEQWMDLKPIFLIFSTYFIWNVDGRLMDCFLRSLGLTRSQFLFRTMQLVLTIVFLIIGAQGGMTGVAIAVISVNAIMALTKMYYIGKRLDIKFGQTLSTVFSSWRFLIYVFPVSLVVSYFAPSTWLGDVIVLGVSCVAVAVVFLLFPSMVGKLYKEELYSKILKRIGINEKRSSL